MNRRSFLQCLGAAAVVPSIPLKRAVSAGPRTMGPFGVNAAMRTIMHEQRVLFGAWQPETARG